MITIIILLRVCISVIFCLFLFHTFWSSFIILFTCLESRLWMSVYNLWCYLDIQIHSVIMSPFCQPFVMFVFMLSYQLDGCHPAVILPGFKSPLCQAIWMSSWLIHYVCMSVLTLFPFFQFAVRINRCILVEMSNIKILLFYENI